MAFASETNWRSYLDCVGDLIETEEVRSMRALPHHIGNTCYEHSVFVSYLAFRLARRMGMDYVTAARAGLLHDLCLYNARDRRNYQGHQCFAHPKAALRNARALCGELTPKEENIILSHMWPLARKMPRSREAVLITVVDKICATAEAMHIWHRMRLRTLLPA
mgnify:FL=1